MTEHKALSAFEIAALVDENERLKKRVADLDDALKAIASDGWLYHGVEGMDECQQRVYDLLSTNQVQSKESPK